MNKKKKRRAIVLSTHIFNESTKMALVCPITSNNKYFPTHYKLEDSKKIKCSILCEHIRSIDYNERNIKYVESASSNDLLSTIMLLNACIEE